MISYIQKLVKEMEEKNVSKQATAVLIKICFVFTSF